jgi:hypothetical protein
MSLVTYWRTRLVLLSGGAVACILATVSGNVLGLPAVGSPAGSLLAQPSPAGAMLLTAGLIVVSCLLGTLIGSRIRPDAGIFAAGFALIALSWHSGTMREVLFAAQPAANPFLMLAVELAVLGSVFGLCQFVLLKLVASGRIAPDDHRDGVPGPSATSGDAVLAVVCTAAATVLLAWFLLPTDGKQQAIYGLGTAAFLATAGVHFFISPKTPVWPHWLGVILGGIAIYCYTYTNPGIMAIGSVAIPPARALPIDYAGTGIVGATGAYWYARIWKRVEPETP